MIKLTKLDPIDDSYALVISGVVDVDLYKMPVDVRTDIGRNTRRHICATWTIERALEHTMNAVGVFQWSWF